jgi:hypothetical protein
MSDRYQVQNQGQHHRLASHNESSSAVEINFMGDNGDINQPLSEEEELELLNNLPSDLSSS